MTTKEKVLEILSTDQGKPVSGEKLAQECGISRAAIWKAISSLREQGCNIEGTTNGGYVLLSSDLFSESAFVEYLAKKYPDLAKAHVETFSVIDSTNTYAKKLLSENGNLRTASGELTESGHKFHNSIYVAENQTAGHGRLGRTFLSPSRTGIYLSVIYAPKGGITNPAALTALSAVAVCRVIKRLYNLDASIKWINDIFLNGKKICGILTEGFTNFETGTIESAVVGIGINISDNPEVFSEDLRKTAGSITGSLENVKVSRCQLAAEVAGETLSIFTEDVNKVMAEYKSLSFLIGQTVEVHPVIGDTTKSYFAKVIDIDNNAGLAVQLEDGSKKTLSSGEVSLHSSYAVHFLKAASTASS